MIKFEKVSRFEDVILPSRATKDSAGYDLYAAEDIIIPAYDKHITEMTNAWIKDDNLLPGKPLTLDQVASITKATKAKPTLVSTGIKCAMEAGQYLELSVRSSTPLKHWLILANGVGIVDRDYYNNPDNEGEIFLQMINLAPFDILIQKGDKIGQGIIKTYNLTDDDAATGMRLGGFGSTT